MKTSCFDLLQTTFQKGLVILLNFVDDALVLILSKWGVTLPGGQWFSLLLLGISVTFWGYRLTRWLWKRHVRRRAAIATAQL
jgi:hypothetical protein